ncbi:hypothetical protein GCM10010168_55720 [Actinoplanes ianthinogenes]|uniref:Uncharacterized protein n=1 Tax=Actinoplanes ianthinogenes TaxID=122358 RepID=A0ABN6C7R6_9ACTN|nr:hypothetical protein [Actinoplanes ianthinogenes]BCJ41429.1 hypothetical protein Aiant_20860 [Actinoplanes ianthinogenes]GGR30176.1 hypothetical protein GCM10010168_55720 [Actinoplanes ianthinogenes]
MPPTAKDRLTAVAFRRPVVTALCLFLLIGAAGAFAGYLVQERTDLDPVPFVVVFAGLGGVLASGFVTRAERRKRAR